MTPADILAVIERESGNCLYFRATDALLAWNTSDAEKITGLSKDVIHKAMIIGAGPHKGQISKFRCEPGYWAWAKNLSGLSDVDKLLLSCSFGYGQKMSRWLVGKLPKPEWIPFVRNFMGNTSLQIMYIAGDLDQLLKLSNGDRALAFTRYNAGPGATAKSPAHKNYGTPVAKRAAEIHEYLGIEGLTKVKEP